MAIEPFNRQRFTISQRFGVRNTAYRLNYHPGTDYRTPTGTPVRAPVRGFVRWLWSNSYGNVAALVRPNGDVIWFAHNSRAGKTGNVNQGDVIAYTGNTGWSTGPHSHIEYRINGDQNSPRDFEAWLNANLAPTFSGMPKIGENIRLSRGVNRTTFRRGTTTRAGVIRPTDNTSFVYRVRGYDANYPNRIIINSRSAGGNGVALALFYTNGNRIEGWTKL